MPDTPQSLAERLREEGDRVVAFFSSLSADQWGTLIYPQQGDWSMRHLLAHFVSSEIGRRSLIESILAGGRGAPTNFDIDSFNQQEVEKLSGESNHSLLELFQQERSQLARLIASLETSDLDRIGNDPYLGAVPLHEIIKLTYRHLQIHLRDARKIFV